MKEHIPYTDSIVFAAEYMVRACREYAKKAIKDNNLPLNYEEYLILDVVCANPGLIQMEIAKKIFMQRSYLSKLLTALEEQNYIKREQSIKGKRQVVMSIYITKQGEKICSEMKNVFRNQILKKILIDHSKMEKVKDELFEIGDKLVQTFNLKL